MRAAHHTGYRVGVQRVLAHAGLLPPMPAAPEPMLVLRGSGDMDTRLTVSQPGLLLDDVQLLDHVRTGDVLGRVIDPSDRSEREIVRAPHDGVVGMARRTARVEPGDGVYTLTSVWAATR